MLLLNNWLLSLIIVCSLRLRRSYVLSILLWSLIYGLSNICILILVLVDNKILVRVSDWIHNRISINNRIRISINNSSLLICQTILLRNYRPLLILISLWNCLLNIVKYLKKKIIRSLWSLYSWLIWRWIDCKQIQLLLIQDLPSKLLSKKSVP